MQSPRYLPRLRSLATTGAVAICLLVNHSNARPAPESPQPEVRYKATEIPLPLGVDEGPIAINQTGDVVGNAVGDGQPSQTGGAFYYHQGKVTYLGSGKDGVSQAITVNNRGQVLLKHAESPEGPGDYSIWDRGKVTPIGPMPTELHDWHGFGGPNGKVSYWVISAMNDSGQVAGYMVQEAFASEGLRVIRPFCWQNGTVTELNAAGATSLRQQRIDDFVPSAMNNRGEIIGYWPDSGGSMPPRYCYAVTWKDGIVQTVRVPSKRDSSASPPRAADLVPSDRLRPAAINNKGEWVGTHEMWPERLRRENQYLGRGEHACLWSGEVDAVHDLDETFANLSEGSSVQRLPLDSYAYGINDKGQVVGKIDDSVVTSSGSTRNEERACLWQEGKAYDLTRLIDKSAGVVLETACGINDVGQIVATGQRADSGDLTGTHAYILTPIRHG